MLTKKRKEPEKIDDGKMTESVAETGDDKHNRKDGAEDSESMKGGMGVEGQGSEEPVEGATAVATVTCEAAAAAAAPARKPCAGPRV